MNTTSRISRRRFLAAVGATALASPVAFPAATKTASLSARPDESPMAPFDDEVGQFMRARRIPGGALAVVRNGRLVYTRGYGQANREKEVSVRPTSLFRIASVSKPFTAVTVLKLVEAGRLSLDDRVFDLVRLPPLLPPGKQRDPRLERITVRQLLHHTGGWDREKSFDPMFRSREIAEACGVPSPAGPTEIIRYMLGQSLDFDPGTRTAYSNFGYCVLGRVIEHVGGAPYGKFVQESLLAPAGIRWMRLGRSLAAQSAPGEVHYYTAERGVTGSVFASDPGKVPWPYGGFCLEAMDAHGGWLASAVDLARFAAVLDDPAHSPVLKPETFHRLYAPPDAPVSRNPDGTVKDHFYACGWSVRPVRQAGKANYWHSGSLPGTATLLVRRWDGLSWVVLFNQRSEDPKLPDGAIDLALHRAADAVTEWPDEDLFPRYGV